MHAAADRGRALPTEDTTAGPLGGVHPNHAAAGDIQVRSFVADAASVDLGPIIRDGCILQPDASLIGGLSIFRQVAQMCAHKHIPVAVHAWCGGVGIMGNFHAAFATENCTYLELSNVPNPLREEVMVEPFQILDGKLGAPAAPGLGVHLPNDLIEKYPYRPGSVYRILGN